MYRPPPRLAPHSQPPPALPFASEVHTRPSPAASAHSSELPPHSSHGREQLMRLALATGTGEDIAALAEPTSAKKARLRLSGKPLQALVVLIVALCAFGWAYFGRAAAQAENMSQQIEPVSDVQESGAAGESIGLTDESGVSEEESMTPQGAQPSTADGPAGSVVVYISGAVAAPGVYTAAAGARINDIVGLAGGLGESAEATRINLAAPVADGEHIHIPAIGEAPMAAEQGSGTSGSPSDTAAQTAGKININTASVEELESLPGIGPALAGAIATWRQENGRFTTAEDLLEVSGIGNAKFAQLKDKVTVG